MDLEINKQWYLVQCKPREAFRAEQHLQNQSIECFLPTHKVRRKQGDRVKWSAEPLFPHYLFVHMAPEDNWSAIRSTRGVSKVVEFSGKPAKVPEFIVPALQRQRASSAELHPEPLYKPGDSVTVTEGSFRELEALVKAAKGEDRVILLLNILNRQQEVEVPVRSIRPT